MSKQKVRHRETAKTGDGPCAPVKKQLEPGARAGVPEHNEIAALAYKLWQERGSRLGSELDDWFRAEEQLKNPKVRVAAGGA